MEELRELNRLWNFAHDFDHLQPGDEQMMVVVSAGVYHIVAEAHSTLTADGTDAATLTGIKVLDAADAGAGHHPCHEGGGRDDLHGVPWSFLQ